MSTAKNEYVRIAGRGLKRGDASLLIRTRARLWAGKTHLLLVYNSGYSEEYRRFYYKDIQAITLSRTNRGRNMSIALAVATAILLLLSLKILYLAFLPAITLIFLIGNLIAGPTCATVLRTAVSSEELPSLGRLRNAVRAMDFLRPLIEEAQKDIAIDPASAMIPEPVPSLKSSVQAAPVSPDGHEPVHTAYNGWAHFVLFSLMMTTGLCFGTELLFNRGYAKYVGGFLSFATTFLAIFALIKQKGSRLEKGLRRTTCSSLSYIFLTYIGLVFFMVDYSIASVSNSNGNIDQKIAMLSMYSHVSRFTHPAERVFLLLMATYSVFAGICGLSRTMVSRRRVG